MTPVTMLVQPMLGFTLGLVLVLALRRGTRQLFGACAAYALWVLPLVTTLGALLPTWTGSPLQTLPAIKAWHGAVSQTAAAMHGGHAWTMAWLALWVAGTALALARLAIAHIRLHRDTRPMPRDYRTELERMGASALIPRIRLHAAGPAVIWAGRNLMLLPANFLSRFEPRQRSLVVAHEATHLRHGDALWNLLYELLAAMLWFHPLLWLARSRFRMDQELACDASMLERHPDASCAYAQTLLRGTGYAGTPVLATWLDEPQLKERLTMIRDRATRKPLRRMALPALAVLFAGGVLSAQAMGSLGTPPGLQPPSASMKFRLKAPPVYPAYAIKHHLEGNVILRVKVNAHGEPVQVIPEPGKADPSLVKAAITAAKNWRYHPATKHGKPVVGWAKIPVYFRLGKDAGTRK